MNFSFEEAIEILERTPLTLETLLVGLSKGWLECDEGDGTWNASQVINHLIECEKTNWIPRLEWIFTQADRKPFPPFDRFSHMKSQGEHSMNERVRQFQLLRTANIEKLRGLVNPTLHLELTGLHPVFGKVTVQELLSTWVVHDFTHLNQMGRIMAKRYQEDVGPWKEYLGVLNK